MSRSIVAVALVAPLLACSSNSPPVTQSSVETPAGAMTDPSVPIAGQGGAAVTGQPGAAPPTAANTPPGVPTNQAGAGPTQPGQPGQPGLPNAGTPPVPDEDWDVAGGDRANWVGFGGGLEQSFARTDAMISKSNLAMIGEAWQKPAEGGVTSTPAIYDGVVYWTDWAGTVNADTITDGTPVWTQKFDRGFTSSPFVTADRVYLSNRDNLVMALDRATGAKVWSTPISDSEIAQLWSSPTVVDGLVIVGLGGKGTSDGGIPLSSANLMAFRGAVVALDAATGAVRWRFENTIAEGMMYGPGVSSWSSPAIDTVRKIAYIGTGNSYYAPASPYSDSLLALDYSTTDPDGHLLWSKQFTADDNFTSASPYGPDSDVGATPNLYTIAGRDYVSVGDKGGRFYILDRVTGELLFKIPVGAGSSTGGVMAPASYADGKLYVTSNDTGTTEVTRIDGASGMVDWQVTVYSGVHFGAPLLLSDVLLVGTTQSFPSGTGRPGEIVALDRNTGDQVPGWSLPLPHQRGGGMSIHNNTLFVGFGFVFESSSSERTLQGGLLAAAIGGKVIQAEPQGPTATYAPTYSAIWGEILEQQGCGADRCHAGLGIMLSEKAAGYANLTSGAGTMSCAGMKFIVPGSPDQSLLYRKLADAMPPCGSRMPLSLQPLKPEELTQIRTWIEQGALDN